MIYINYLLDHERWRDIKIERVKEMYQVSDRGRVRNKNTDYILRPRLDHSGYYTVSLEKVGITGGNHRQLIHRLVLKMFNPIDNDMEMVGDHINGNKLDNRIINLEWCTRGENLRRAKEMGLLNIPRGEAHPKSRFSDSFVNQICIYLKQNKSTKDIIELTGLDDAYNNRRFIKDVKYRKIYTHISNFYDWEVKKHRDPLPKQSVERICELLEYGKNYSTILNDVGLDNSINNISILSSIRRGTQYKSISANFDFEKCPMYKRRSEQMVTSICELLDSGKSVKEIIDELNIPNIESERNFIRKVRSGHSFKNISKNYKFIMKKLQ